MTTTFTSSKLLHYGAGLLVIAGLVAGVQAFPPLTEGGLARSVHPVVASGAAADPAAYCRENLSGVNCACFAQKAGEVLSKPYDPIQGLSYADRWDLARGQAGDSC
ncbi:hypothetical protein [Antarctobacter jejuensis]|uniref:hypothetical protein n=1 Tax=Antarctobacter jejuensis TaxID=1439938 RepID=UPI003FD5272A